MGHYNGEGMPLLDYVDARRRIYLPAYRQYIDRHCAETILRLKGIARDRKVALVDYGTNGDVTNTKSPLAHAALLRRYLLGEYPV